MSLHLGASPAGGKARTRAALALALATALLTLAALSPSAQAVPRNFWGVVPQQLPSQEQFQRLHRGGVKSVRVPLGWAAIQPTRRGPLNWSASDDAVARASLAGVEVLPFVAGAPAWAVPASWVPGSGRSVKAPVRLPIRGAAAGAWRSFVRQAVGRYGPRGSFWAANPAIPRRPVRTWQVWNEENFQYFNTKPNPGEYGKLVKLTAATIRAADPGARVLLGGLFSLPKGCRSKAKHKVNYCASDFLQAMYERTPGVRASFDGAALHPYTIRYQQLTPYIEEVRDVLDANHDGAKGLWITELGWSSQRPDPVRNVFAKGPAGQAAQLRGAFSLLKRKQVRWRIKQVYWFSVDDMSGVCNFCDGTGLFGPEFTPKRSWFDYVRFAGGRPS